MSSWLERWIVRRDVRVRPRPVDGRWKCVSLTPLLPTPDHRGMLRRACRTNRSHRPIESLLRSRCSFAAERVSDVDPTAADDLCTLATEIDDAIDDIRSLASAST